MPNLTTMQTQSRSFKMENVFLALDHVLGKCPVGCVSLMQKVPTLVRVGKK